LIGYNGGTARIGIDTIVRCTHMLMQLRLGKESLAAAHAGMRLLSGMYAPKGNKPKVMSTIGI